MNENFELDNKLDYKSIYSALLEKAKIVGDNMTGCCPIHKDKNPSFSVDLKTGRCRCFSCGWEGNYISLYAALHNMDSKEAYKAILEENHLDTAPEKPKPPENYTAADYAREKGFDPEWLKAATGMEKSGKDRDGQPWVRIPYYNRDGAEVLFRKRFTKHASQRFKWGAGSAGKLIMYGEWRLDDAEEENRVVLVEGESDAQTLWLLGIPALGIPGASTYRPEWTTRLKDIGRIYLHIEPDSGGQVFLEQMSRKLREGEYNGEVYTWSCSIYGVKDPSDLFLKFGDKDATEKIEAALTAAKPLDLNRLQDEIPAVIKDAPLNLRQPAGWIYDEHGIQKIDEKTMQPTIVCKTPLIITQRIIGQDTGEEKIEVAFKRDGSWRSAIFPRTTIFVSRNVVELAKLGATITSENAKHVVSFMSALEAENLEVIPTTTSTTTFGWQPRGKFLPWHAEDMTLDVHPTMQRWAGACVKNGSLEGWVNAIKRHRERYAFRFLIAASFTAPLLRIIRGRSFVVYNWCNSRSGKTAALKAALSAWGDPDRLMVTFNATRVAFERMAGFFCDLPLGIDERQLAGSKQEGLETLVYMMANGVSRGRGSKEGGIQEINTWRTVAVTTGEEPIARNTTMSGVITRTIEVTQPPFTREADAAEMHRLSAENTGFAGDAYIAHLIAAGDSAISELYSDIAIEVEQITGQRNGSHASSLAAVATADRIISTLFFGESEADAKQHSLDMIRGIVGDMSADELPDVNVSAAQFIGDWIAMNKERSFAADCIGPRYGINEGTETAYILPTPLREAMEKAGFSYRKTMKWLRENGVITAEQNEDRYTIVKKIRDSHLRVIPISLKKLTEKTTTNVFKDVSDDEELPF